MLAERLRSAREAAGLSRRDLAKHITMSVRAVERAEAGKTTPRAEKLLAWAAACGASLSDLTSTPETINTNARGASAGAA